MGCPHASGCPLFPYLNASLGAWRTSYCDSVSGWRGCARYNLSSQGRPVPLALLPNGRLPVSMVPSVGRAGALDVTHDLQHGHAPAPRRSSAPPVAPVAPTAATRSVIPRPPAPEELLRRPGRHDAATPPAQHLRSAGSPPASADPWRSDDGVEVVHRQDWTPTPRRSWWRRLRDWLGTPV